MQAIPSMYYRYFVRSATEGDRLRKVHGATLQLGAVIVNGVPKEYTSIVSDPERMPSDGIVVVKGDIRKIKYTPMSY